MCNITAPDQTEAVSTWGSWMLPNLCQREGTQGPPKNKQDRTKHPHGAAAETRVKGRCTTPSAQALRSADLLTLGMSSNQTRRQATKTGSLQRQQAPGSRTPNMGPRSTVKSILKMFKEIKSGTQRNKKWNFLQATRNSILTRAGPTNI